MVGTPEIHYRRIICLNCNQSFKTAYETDNSTYAGMSHVHPECPYCDTKICTSADNVKKFDDTTNNIIEVKHLKTEQKRLQRNSLARERYNAIPEELRKSIKHQYNLNMKDKRRERGLHRRGPKPMTKEQKAERLRQRIERNKAIRDREE